jgi:septum site-determining protein MinC
LLNLDARCYNSHYITETVTGLTGASDAPFQNSLNEGSKPDGDHLMLKSELVRVSGRGANVEFLIDDGSTFDEITLGLRDYLAEHANLWSGGSITVNVGRRIVSQDQLAELKEIFERQSGLKVARFSCPPESLSSQGGDTGGLIAPDSAPASTGVSGPISPRRDAATARQRPAEPTRTRNASKADASDAQRTVSANVRWDTALLVKATCRSGESIRHDGDVVVLGDVNPGAEIIAEGDIVVFGQLRGFAHAGSKGNTRSAIVALNLDSPRIQIGPHAGTSAQAGQRRKGPATGPMIAYVRRKGIHLAPFVGRFANYGRGEPYDG